MRRTILGFSFFILALSISSAAIAGTDATANTVSGVTNALAPALGLQSGALPTASVNTDQCILGIDQDFQDGFDKDELSQYCSGISLEAIPSDPLGMKACGDTDMSIPDLKEDNGKDQFCSQAGKNKEFEEDVFKKDLCELGRDLNCKKRAEKKTLNKLECIDKRLAELGQYLGQTLSPALDQILTTAQKRITEYTDFISERERQAKQLATRANELNEVMNAIKPVLDNKFIASQGDDFYRDFQKSQEQEKTRYATETCMNASAGLKCGGSTNMSPYDFIICRSGEVATGKQKAGRLTPMQAAMKESASAGVREWMEKILKFDDLNAMPTADGAPQAKKNIMDDVSFQRRLNTTQIVFKEVKSANGGFARAKVSSQSIINELQSQLSACKSKVANDANLKERLIENEKTAAKQFVGPMTQLADAYKKLMRAATGSAAVDLSMSTCEAGSLQVKRDCVYHLASQLRSAMTGDNESGHTNPYGRLDARALGLRTLPNPQTMFNRPLKSELAFGGQNMSLAFNCRGIEQCVQEYKNKNEEFTQIISQGRAKLQPNSSDMFAFNEAMKNQVRSTGAQLSQITGAINKQWGSISGELAALGAEGAELENDKSDGSDSTDSDKSGLPSLSKLLAQAKSMGGMLKVPNPGTTKARTNLTKVREKLDDKYADLKALLSGYESQVASCESKSKKKAEDDIIAMCGNLNKDEGKSTIAEFLKSGSAYLAAEELKKCDDDNKKDTPEHKNCRDRVMDKYSSQKYAASDNTVKDDERTKTRAERCDEIQTALMEKKFEKFSGTGTEGGVKSGGGN